MSLCRYYLKGTCRFGDRCRFLHTDDENRHSSQQHNQYGTPGRGSKYETEVETYGQERYSRYDQYQSGKNQGYDSFDRYGQNELYESSHRYNQNQRYGSERINQNQRYDPSYQNYNRYDSDDSYSSNQRHDSAERHDQPHRYESAERNNQNQRFGSASRDNQSQRYGSSERNSQTQQYDVNDHYSDNTYGDNRFRWLSSDYNKQNHSQNVHKDNTAYRDSKLSTSTPKSKISFSFKVPESEIQKETSIKGSNVAREEEDQQIYAILIKEEAKAWELGNQYPFSCFFPFPDKPGYPGFTDVSPEELRYEAYVAKENNTYDSYVNSVASALLEVQRKRTLLKSASPQILDVIESIRRNEQLTPDGLASKTFGNEGSLQLDHMQPNKPTLLNQKQFGKASASTFSFVLPPDSSSSMAPSVGATSSTEKDSSIYTPIDKLTSDDKREFESSTFTLGKIPTKPPPYVMCF